MPNFTLTYNVTVLAVKLYPYNEIEDTDEDMQVQFDSANSNDTSKYIILKTEC